MVCGWLSVDKVEKWCEVAGGRFKVFADAPESDVALKDAQLSIGPEGAWVLDGMWLEGRAATDKATWLQSLQHACSDRERELDRREAALAHREAEILWREHREKTRNTATTTHTHPQHHHHHHACSTPLPAYPPAAPVPSLWSMTSEGSSKSPARSAAATPSPGVSPGMAPLLDPQQHQHRTRVHLPGSARHTPVCDSEAEPQQQQQQPDSHCSDVPAAAHTPEVLCTASATDDRYMEGRVTAADGEVIRSGVEELDSSPEREPAARGRQAAAAAFPAPPCPAAAAVAEGQTEASDACPVSEGSGVPAAAAAQQQQQQQQQEMPRVVLEAPGKTVAIYPSDAGDGLVLEVNGESLGRLTWLGYDAGRRWVTTGTDTSRSGMALPEGGQGQRLLALLAATAEAAGVRHNLPLQGRLKEGCRVKTRRSLRHSGGRVPIGTVATVVAVPGDGSVKVKTASEKVFSVPATAVEAIGEVRQSFSADKKIADYVSHHMQEEDQEHFASLDDELAAIMQAADGM